MPALATAIYEATAGSAAIDGDRTCRWRVTQAVELPLLRAQYSKTGCSLPRRGRTISMAAAVLLRGDAATLFVAMTRLPAWIVHVGCLLDQRVRHGEA